MSFGIAFALYFLFWWLCLFVVLPFGSRSQIEDQVVASGTEPGAPSKAHIGRKLLVNSILAGAMFVLYWLITVKFGYSLDNIPDLFSRG